MTRGGDTTATAGIDGRVLGTAGTTPRFLLLAALILVSALSLFENVNAVLAYDSQDDLLGGIGCYLAAGEDPTGDHTANQVALKRPGVAEALDTCLDRFGLRAAVWPLLVEMGLLVMAAVLLYWVLPLWKGRRVVPLDERIDPTGELRELVDGLVAVAGLAHPPRFVVNPAVLTPGAVVFGRWRRHTVCLYGGLLVRREADPEGFRGVVLHELAHLRNRDVDITYGTVALWRVFLVVLPADVLLSIAYLLRDGGFVEANRESGAYGLVRTAFLVVLVYLARADLLRVRELHADLAAARWGADFRGWRGTSSPPGGDRVGLPRSFAELWRTHPSWARRERALAEPARLFDVQRLPVFLTGAAVLVAVAEARSSFTVLQGDAFAVTKWLATMFGAGLATAVVGTLLWRTAIHAVITEQRGPSGIGTGLWFGAGLVTGELVLGRTSDRWLPERPSFLLVLLLIGVVITWWTARHAELWAGTWRGRTPRRPVLVTLTATWLVFGMWFAWWQSEGQRWVEGRPIVNPEGVLRLYATQYPGLLDAETDLGGSATIAAVHWVLGRVGADQDVLPSEQGVTWAGALLWLLPLLTCLRRPAATVARARPAGVRPAPGLSLRRVMRCAAVGGLLALGGLVAVRALLRGAIPPGPGWLPALVLHASVWTTAALVGAMVVAAWAAGARSGEHVLLTGLVTAGATALVGLAAVFVLASADGCLGPLDAVFETCGWRPREGWSDVTDVARPVLGLGIFAIAVAMLPMAAVARRTRAPLVAPVRRARLLVAVVVAAAVALITTSGSAAVRVSSATADGTALTAADFPVASSPQIHSIRVLSWLKYGGRDLLNGISERQNAFATEATTPPLAYDDVVSRVRPVCVAIERDVAEARAYFSVPDDEAQHHWANYLDLSGEAATSCRRAIDTRDVDSFRDTVGRQMQETYFAHKEVHDRFRTFFG